MGNHSGTLLLMNNLKFQQKKLELRVVGSKMEEKERKTVLKD